MKKKTAGFTLAEAMLAMLFISIAFFAYISLHMRIIHSNSKLEGRQTIREKVASETAVKRAKARAGETTKTGLSGTALPLPSADNTTNTTTSSSSSSFPEFQAYSNSTTVGGGARSTAYDNSGYQSSTAYNQSSSVDQADWGRVANGGDSTISIRYEEGAATQNPTGLPPNLKLVETIAPFSDRNGEHTYSMDCYERVQLIRW